MKNVMNLMPEEKFIQSLWTTLKKIKENSLYAKSGKPISISSAFVDERVLEKLEEWQVLKIRENPWEFPASTKDIFYLDVNWQRFNELYNLCKNGLETEIEPERLLKMIKEWVHPIGNDEKISFEIWELIKGKKKALERVRELRRQFTELREKARRITQEKIYVIANVFWDKLEALRKQLQRGEGATVHEVKELWEMLQVELGKPTSRLALKEEEQKPLTDEEKEEKEKLDQLLKIVYEQQGKIISPLLDTKQQGKRRKQRTN